MAFPLPPATFAWPAQFCAFVTAATYVTSIITSNVSQVDRLWTFLPTIYTAYFALLPLWPRGAQPFLLCPYVPKELAEYAEDYSPRALVMLALTVIWMFRLSYNTFRRGLFSLSDEDYRWAVLRQKIPPSLFQVTNLVFIAAIQNVLLLGLGVPTYFAVTQPHNGLVLSDVFFAILHLIVLATEFTADNQQYAFQTYKHGGADKYDEKRDVWPGARLNWTADDAKRGFVTKGLWAYARHPNFTCEQMIWWIINFIPIAAPFPPDVPHYTLEDILAFTSGVVDTVRSGGLLAVYDAYKEPALNVLSALSPLLPAFSLSALFLSSTIYTESITVSKYPRAYRAYQRRVGMFGFSLGKWLYAKVFGDQETEELVWGSVKDKEL